MDYDFSRLSTRSFEQLVQAISLASLGSGVNIFGDGPDGAREATFEGAVAFPNATNHWNGYGVIQAKFRQKPGIKDADWALAELSADLEKFLDENRNLRKPEYYIFATNVILTPVSSVGGKDKVNALLESYKKKIGIKDFRVWDRDQICSYLDLYEGIRKSYSAWITSGDVLSAVLDNMRPVRADFKSLMLNFVRKELTSQQYVNLGQAGSSADDKIPLACVFVDVPIKGGRVPRKEGIVASKKDVAAAASSEMNELTSYSAVKNLLHISGLRLDTASVPPNVHGRGDYIHQIPGRVVFIGGPGQGKSTLTQFFCQMHRAALLSQYNLEPMTPEVRNAFGLIIEQCKVEGLSSPSVPRFPIRIELNRFASDLAKGAASSLFNYILEMIKRRCDRELVADDLRGWLGAYPWLVALDGLDEVPASSNRSEVLQKINDFLIDSQECNSDLMVVATSRPQGYNDDFAEKYYCHLVLSPLTPENALHYADRLISRRWGDDHDKISTFNRRMSRASEEESTARLMRSPLQVTIMTLLVESLGEPPKERWRLFNEYYQVINRREKERDIPAAKLLSTYQADIDVIHQEVGRVLQQKSEYGGSTDALLSTEEFSSIIDFRLQSEEHPDQERNRLRLEILNAALERLVFLVAPQEGRVGFEIRSLQEFMAAQSLMNGPDRDVVARLQAVAHASHWRNVFLFAAGRCFYDKQHLRSYILSICMELNEDVQGGAGSKLSSLLLVGSQLALDILEDGAISNQPGQRRYFLRLAMRVLELPPHECQERLAALYDPVLKNVYEESLLHLLQDSSQLRYYGAWHVILVLVAQKIEWACAAADKFWPMNPESALGILRSIKSTAGSEFLMQKAGFLFISTVPSKVLPGDLQVLSEIARNAGIPIPAWANFLFKANGSRSDRLEVNVHGVSQSFRFLIDNGAVELTSLPDSKSAHPLWLWVFDACGVMLDCSELQLARLFSDLKKISPAFEVSQLGSWLWIVPWPVAMCLKNLDDIRTLDFYCAKAASGELGNLDVWKQAKMRWNDFGISDKDFNYMPNEGLPYDARINSIGFPYAAAGASILHSRDVVSTEIFNLMQCVNRLDAKRELANKYLFALSCQGVAPLVSGSLELDSLSQIVEWSNTKWLHMSFLKVLPLEYIKGPEMIRVLDSMSGRAYEIIEGLDEEVYEAVESFVFSNSDSFEGLKLLAACCLRGFRPTSTSDWITPDRYNSSLSKAYASIVLIAGRRLAKSNALTTAQSIAEVINSPFFTAELNVIGELVAILPVEESSREAKEVFLSHLQESFKVENLEFKCVVFDSMQELQRSHLSSPFC
ncbi:NACHT domain-containing protein [Pseudomonas folii]|uniref:NACHT domain-containing protein n=1 Tax=Pseudomonas folii TaxID=2762593 RepID=A0ABR7ATL0_9PSED|nr:hypothetical protein [Pseudomonas folii]MBC3948259.1 hypothetical protein [Pseudomonas folii]